MPAQDVYISTYVRRAGRYLVSRSTYVRRAGGCLVSLSTYARRAGGCLVSPSTYVRRAGRCLVSSTSVVYEYVVFIPGARYFTRVSAQKNLWDSRGKKEHEEKKWVLITASIIGHTRSSLGKAFNEKVTIVTGSASRSKQPRQR